MSKNIDNILICGLGAVGVTFASQFEASSNCVLKILADEGRIQKYKKNKPIFNNHEMDFEYITPEASFCADLVIVTTKSYNLTEVIPMLKNFINENTIVISLINGITSEQEIMKVYPHATVLKSYFIGHSAQRISNSTTQDGVGEIVCEKNIKLEEIFKRNNIKYSMPDDIDYSMWLKFTMNIFSNQPSAILNLSFGEMKRNNQFINLAKKIIKEVMVVAEKAGINNLNNLENDAFCALSKMCDEGKTSMLQDIHAGRKTEVDIFAGEIIRLGKLYNIPTPYNQVLYDLIKIKEEVFQ